MKTLILVGGGHAHLIAVHAFLKEKVDFHIVLISPSRYQYYSGMFSGFAEGLYDEEDIRIDLKDLCQRANIAFIKDKMVRFDPDNKKVYCSAGQSFSFDAISFDIGSKSKMNPPVLPIKPNYLFPEHMENLRRSPMPVIVGGGAAGVELAFSMLAWRKKHLEQKDVTLISSSKLLPSFGSITSKKIQQIAHLKGLQIIVGEKVTDITSSHVCTDMQKSLEHTGVLWLTGTKPFDLFEKVTTDDKNFLIVNDYLQSVDYPFVFGAGDCVSINTYSRLPKNGINAVRQGSILWDNVKSYMVGERLKIFKPQKRYVAILSTGNKKALFTYGRFSVHSRLAWKVKHYIDHKFMKRFK